MSVVYRQDSHIYITGGLIEGENGEEEPSKKCYLYNAQKNTVEVLPEMKQARYKHFGLIKERKLYVFGGKKEGPGKNEK